MDLNYFYHRRGESLMRAAEATCDQSRDGHLTRARGYAERIAEMRRAHMADAA